MALIKSALELALERTKDIQVDKEGLEAKEYRETGMRLVAKASDGETDLRAELGKLSGKRLEWAREGMRQVLVSYLTLPSSKDQVDRFRAAAPAFLAASRDEAAIQPLLQELDQFFGQYLTQREQLIDAVYKQLEPALRQKEEALAKQGRRVRLTVETDPEFSKYLTSNLDKMVAQYNQALDQVKAEMLELLA